MKKITLTDYIDLNFILIGISSHERDIRFCFKLNHLLQLDLERIEDVELIQQKTKSELSFSCFQFIDPDTELEYTVYANRCGSVSLLPGLRQTDYLLKISGDIELADPIEIINKLKTLPEVLTAVNINPSETKLIENILI
ncbi:MAG: IPExxxVDY family protein [Bacteroidetes bacterium]|nr:IPExxxVDY family protein [Bacteroidota bacterium]